MDDDLGIFWRFIGCADPGEIADLAGPRFLVKIFWISRFANFERGIDEDFDKLRVALERNFAGTATIHSIRRNECRDHDRASICH